MHKKRKRRQGTKKNEKLQTEIEKKEKPLQKNKDREEVKKKQ